MPIFQQLQGLNLHSVPFSSLLEVCVTLQDISLQVKGGQVGAANVSCWFKLALAWFWGANTHLRTQVEVKLGTVKPKVNRCLSLGFLTGPLGDLVESPCSVLLCSVGNSPDMKTPEQQRPTLRGSTSRPRRKNHGVFWRKTEHDGVILLAFFCLFVW